MSVTQPTRGATEETSNTWRAHPLAARFTKGLLLAAPLVVSLLVTWSARPHIPHSPGFKGALLFLAPLAVLGIATAMLAERIAKRFVPLSNLLSMSLVFPDQAPSRYGTALRSGNAKTLTKSLADNKVGQLSSDETTAALQVLSLVDALGKHERLTAGHTERVRAYSELVAEEMNLSSDDRAKLQWAVLLHDIGKLAVPARILNKTSPLTDEEWEIVKQHPRIGGEIVEPLKHWLGDWRLSASQHHERWDGNGYPLGLAGTDISLAGRIVAVADAYDTITSARSYKKAMTAQAAREELVRCSGKQFDPEVVRAFLRVSVGDVRSIASRVGWLSHVPAAFQPMATTMASTSGAVASGAATTAGAVAAAAMTISSPQAPPHLEVPTAMAFVDEAVESASTDSVPITSALLPEDSSPITSAPPSTATTNPPESTTTSRLRTSTTSSSSITFPATSTTTTTSPPASNPTTTTTPVAEPSEPTEECLAAQEGELELPDADLTGCYLAYLDMAGANLTGADLTDADLTKVDLVGADLSGATLRGADLGASDLAWTDFTNADLTNALLVEAEMLGADLEYATLDGADVSGADLALADLHGAYVRGADLSNTFLMEANLHQADFSDTDLTESDLWLAILTQSNLVGTNFSNSYLIEVDFSDADATDAEFAGSIADQADFTRTRLVNSTGTPHVDDSYWEDTICPNGTTQSSSCY